MSTYLAAVILAGGTSRRLGGVDKATLTLNGVPLLDRGLAAVTGGGANEVDEVVIVGPPRPVQTDRPVTWTLEDPPLGGPLAGLAAGVAALAGQAHGKTPDDGEVSDGGGTSGYGEVSDGGALDTQLPDDAPSPSGWVLALACDLPHAATAVPVLLAGIAAHPAADALVGQDHHGRDQPLLAAYRLDTLRRALSAAGDLHNAPMRILLSRLTATKIVLPRHAAHDIDTWHDANELGVTDPGREDEGARTLPPT